MFNNPKFINANNFFATPTLSKATQARTRRPTLKLDESRALMDMCADLTVNQKGEAYIAIHPAFQDAEDLRMIVKFVATLAKGSGQLFKVGTEKINGKKSIRPTKEGAYFLNLIRSDVERMFRSFPQHNFDPRFKLFADEVRERKLREFVQNLWTLRPEETVRLADSLNGCIASIREKVNSAAFKAGMRNFRKSPTKNNRELQHYHRLLLNNHKQLQVLQLDLGYRRKLRDGRSVHPDLTLEDVKHHWSKLLSALDKQLPADAKVGFARKIEFAPHAFYHIRALFFCDASIVTDDIAMATQVGKCWQADDVTGGNGLFLVRNKKNATEQPTGLGLIALENKDARRRLELLAQSLTATDFFIRFKGAGDRNLFTKGNMPKPVKKRKVKTNDDSVTTIEGTEVSEQTT
jgi:hypothetical protein